VAEIRVERKRRSIWPWILGLALLVVLALWGISAALAADREEAVEGSAEVGVMRQDEVPVIRQVPVAWLPDLGPVDRTPVAAAG
jgi:hypothetical protein